MTEMNRGGPPKPEGHHYASGIGPGLPRNPLCHSELCGHAGTHSLHRQWPHRTARVLGEGAPGGRHHRLQQGLRRG